MYLPPKLSFGVGKCCWFGFWGFFCLFFVHNQWHCTLKEFLKGSPNNTEILFPNTTPGCLIWADGSCCHCFLNVDSYRCLPDCPLLGSIHGTAVARGKPQHASLGRMRVESGILSFVLILHQWWRTEVLNLLHNWLFCLIDCFRLHQAAPRALLKSWLISNSF